MKSSELDSEILSRVKRLNGDQKYVVLEYLEKMPVTKHSTRLYRRRALKQIRRALNDQ